MQVDSKEKKFPLLDMREEVTRIPRKEGVSGGWVKLTFLLFSQSSAAKGISACQSDKEIKKTCLYVTWTQGLIRFSAYKCVHTAALSVFYIFLSTLRVCPSQLMQRLFGRRRKEIISTHIKFPLPLLSAALCRRPL